MALVNINFGEPQALKITKDAKATFADKVGNIGGTFGIFMGFSILGLYDLFVMVYKKAAEMWPVREVKTA